MNMKNLASFSENKIKILNFRRPFVFIFGLGGHMEAILVDMYRAVRFTLNIRVSLRKLNF